MRLCFQKTEKCGIFSPQYLIQSGLGRAVKIRLWDNSKFFESVLKSFGFTAIWNILVTNCQSQNFKSAWKCSTKYAKYHSSTPNIPFHTNLIWPTVRFGGKSKQFGGQINTFSYYGASLRIHTSVVCKRATSNPG